jgi:hypothetical protein
LAILPAALAGVYPQSRGHTPIPAYWDEKTMLDPDSTVLFDLHQ